MWEGSCECLSESMCAEGMGWGGGGGGGLYGYFREQGMPVGIQEYLEGFYRQCAVYLEDRGKLLLKRKNRLRPMLMSILAST